MKILVVKNPEKGLERAKEFLYEEVNKDTVLFLSGGTTPLALYKTLAEEEIIQPVCVAMIDERFGKKFHKDSNELAIQQTNFLRYLAARDIAFYPMLNNLPMEETADIYDQKVRDLFFHFHKSVGIVGVGTDGHIAGIAPNRKDFTNPLFDATRKHMFVDHFIDEKGPFGQRVSLTFAGLSLLDIIIVVAFGKEKKKALQQIFTSGSLSNLPARFLNKPDIAKKTILITDQAI